MKKILFFILMIASNVSLAELTDAQKTTLHTDMASRPELAGFIASGDDIAIAAYYNSLAVPAFVAWRSRVTQDEYQTATSQISTLFSWAGTGGYISRAQGERDAWNSIFKEGFVNPSLPNVISAFNDIFSGNGAAAINNRSHLLSLSKRNATLVEKILSSGAGTDASPAVLSFESPISYVDISEARVWQ